MRRLCALPLALVLSCTSLKTMPPDLPCREAAFAMAARTEECTGNLELANKRVDLFFKDYVCIDADVTDPEMNNPAVHPLDWFNCAFAIREMPCELVEEYGNDIDRYLTQSDACTWVIARKDGKNLGAGR